MTTIRRSASALAALLLAGAATQALAAECVDSPSRNLRFCVDVSGGHASWSVRRDGKLVLAKASADGLVFQGEGPARITGVAGVERSSANSSWEQPWGEERIVRDHHNEMRVKLATTSKVAPAYDIVVRVFDDGVGFRYDYHSVAAGQDVAVMDEATEFRPVGEQKAWWYLARQKERDEYLYHRSGLNEVTLAETPFTLEAPGLFMSIHEAQLVDFSSMNLERTGPNRLKSNLMPWSDGVRVRRTGAFVTPWRTVLIGRAPGELADSRIELNLNDPSKIADTSWIHTGKYVGVWWEMHLNKSTWASGPNHGATTANVERYIDFAAKYGFKGVLAEGWNKGWDGDWVANGDKFSFTESYPDFDMAAITAYGRARGVELIGHNETAGAIANYERQMEAGFAQYQKYGVHTVKTGYVRPNGTIERPLPEGGVGHEWFAGQYAVRHNLLVAETAAKYQIAIDAHEPVKDTGLRRTWPNMLSREGARGQEYNAWGDPTNPPEHVTILPFTRMLSGPMDFTPGVFDVQEGGKTEVTKRAQSTLANQLALYVVLYSPVHMAPDLPENYEKHLDAFQFIRDVPTDWETSRTLDSVIGDYAIVARQDRRSTDWYLGAVTDEVARKKTVTLDFLEPGRRYEAQIYRDAPGADYRTNPVAYQIEKRPVRAGETLTLDMAPGGGTAIRFKALD